MKRTGKGLVELFVKIQIRYFLYIILKIVGVVLSFLIFELSIPDGSKSIGNGWRIDRLDLRDFSVFNVSLGQSSTYVEEIMKNIFNRSTRSFPIEIDCFLN